MDNVCNRCLFSIPSKVEMAKEQEYLRVCGVYSPEPRSEVYCQRLNLNISKLVYYAYARVLKSFPKKGTCCTEAMLKPQYRRDIFDAPSSEDSV